MFLLIVQRALSQLAYPPCPSAVVKKGFSWLCFPSLFATILKPLFFRFPTEIWYRCCFHKRLIDSKFLIVIGSERGLPNWFDRINHRVRGTAQHIKHDKQPQLVWEMGAVPGRILPDISIMSCRSELPRVRSGRAMIKLSKCNVYPYRPFFHSAPPTSPALLRTLGSGIKINFG